MKPESLLIVFHDMRLGGIQRKIIDIIEYHRLYQPNTKITLCLRKKIGIFLDDLPPNIAITAPPTYTNNYTMIWFIFWMIKTILQVRPTQILSYMDLGSIPTIIALKLLPWIKPKLTIGEDILTSRYVHIESHPQLRLLLIKLLYPFANTIIVQTPIQKKDLETIIYNSIPNSKIISSPNWLPLNFPPDLIPPIDKRTIDILYVGRIDDQKNLPLFLEIVKKVSLFKPNIIANIVGDGDRKIKIKKLIKKLGLQSNVFIKKPTLNTVQYYTNAKIFLLTSNYEGFPLTLMEAVSSGCIPIIRNIPELVQFFTKNKSKIIFDTSDQATKLIKQSIQSPPQKIMTYYKYLIQKNQLRDISAYVKCFTRP